MQFLMQRSIALTTMLALTGAVALSQEHEPGPRQRTISVSGTGSVRVKPDLAVATVGVAKQNAALPVAKKQADDATAKIQAALKRVGIAEEDIRTSQFQIYRVQANPREGRNEDQWKVVHMLQVRTKKPETIASVVDAAVAAGATNVQNVGFTVDELAPHRAKARELAVQAALQKARHLASLLGVQVGEVWSVSEVGEFYPAQMAANVRFDMAEGMGGGSGISGGQVEVSTTVSVVFRIVS
jgi:uncharacterized protein